MTMNGKYIIVGSYWNSSEVWGPFDTLEAAREAVERHAKDVKEEGSWDSVKLTYESNYLRCRIEQRCNIRLLGDDED